MTKLVKVINIYFDDEVEYPAVDSGLVLELEDGRMLWHCQDGSVVPFSEGRGKIKPQRSHPLRSTEGQPEQEEPTNTPASPQGTAANREDGDE